MYYFDFQLYLLEKKFKILDALWASQFEFKVI